MSGFQIIGASSVRYDSSWVLFTTQFEGKGTFVDQAGKAIGPNHTGDVYRITEKRERVYSTLERVGRALLGVIATICTLTGALFFSKSVRNLFTESRESIVFAIPEEQTKFKIDQGQVVYTDLQLQYQVCKISDNEELNFALVKRNGTQQLVPVVNGKWNFFKEFRTYAGTASEALLKLAQDKDERWSRDFSRHDGSPITHFLTHPHNSSVKEEEFYKFLLEKDEGGTPRICTLNRQSTVDVLNTIKKKNILINLHDRTEKGETLFTLWAGKGAPEITKLILELDPSVIEQTKKRKESLFVEVALSGSKEEANLLLAAMKSRNIALSPEEEWINRALNNDCEFSDEAFKKLGQELMNKVFYVANAFANEALVKKLKSLGMEDKPIFWPGPSIIARNMDVVTARNTIGGFLSQLKKEGLLLTEAEFKYDKDKHYKKPDQIGRVQGKHFVEKVIKEHSLKHIKVPKKFVVIEKGLSFHLNSSNLEITAETWGLSIYAERIEDSSRKLSLEEAIEFMIVLEKTGYNDCSRGNFCFAQDGIYLIDTEYDNFTPMDPAFSSIESLKNHLTPEDAKTFLAEYEKRKVAFDKAAGEREAARTQHLEVLKNPLKRVTNGYSTRGHTFTFTLSEL